MMWLRCKTGHVLGQQATLAKATDDQMVLVCPRCKDEHLQPVEMAVVDAIALKFSGADTPSADMVMRALRWDNLNGCYGFNYAGMFHGVETDGYIHT